MISRALCVIALLGGCDLLTDTSEKQFDDVSPADNSTVSDLGFGPDGSVYVGTYGGVYRRSGDGFTGITPAPPDETLFLRFFVDNSGSVYWAHYRCAPNCAAWELVPGLPAGRVNQFIRSSANDFYVTIQTDDRAQLYRQSSATTWEPVGGPTYPPTQLYADANGGVWFETQGNELYVVRGSTLTYLFQSSGLAGVGADGTLFYRIDPPSIDLGESNAPIYGTVVARREDGSERVITRGHCTPTDSMACPAPLLGVWTYRQFKLGADGALYYLFTIDPNDGDTTAVMRLSPGETNWKPVSNPQHAWLATHALSLYIGKDSSIWTTGNDQVGGVGEDGSYYNGLFGYVFRSQ